MKIIRWTTKELINSFDNRNLTFADFMRTSVAKEGRQFSDWYTYKIEINVDDVKESK